MKPPFSGEFGETKSLTRGFRPLVTEADRISRAIKSWPNWTLPNGQPPKAPPLLVKPLEGGLTNKSYLLSLDNFSLVLRINALDSRILGIDRAAESVILEAVAQIYLTPPVVFIDRDFQYLVSEYRASERMACGYGPGLKPVMLDVLERFKSIKLSIAPYDYVGHLQKYLHHINKSGITIDKPHCERWNVFLPKLVQLQDSTAPRSLCHHDLVEDNILVNESGAVEIIDWEYAGVGFPELDLLQVDPDADVQPLLRELAFWLKYLWCKLREE